MKTFLLAFAFLISICAMAQSASDTLIWNDGTVYYGKLEKKGRSEVQFRTQDGQMHYVSTVSIASVRLADGSGDALLMPSPRDTAGDARAAAKRAARKAETDSLKKAEINSINEMSAEKPPVDWSDPTLPKHILRKHRTGVGLAVTGAALVAGGIAMLAAGVVQNGQTSTVSNSYSSQTNVNVGPVGLAGILSVIAGLPMTIVGGVKAAKAKRLARERLIHLH